MKKLLSLVLALIFIMGCLATMSSCAILDLFNTDDTPDEDIPPITEPPITEETDVAIIKDGAPQFTIVYPDGSSVELREKLTALTAQIKETTGVTMKSIKASEATDPNARYILLGATGHEASFAAMGSLSNNEDAYSIAAEGKHIVFVAHFESTLLTAIDYYTFNSIEDNYDSETETLVFEDRNRKGKDPLATAFDMNDIDKYTIIYSPEMPDYYNTAVSIRNHIASVTGVSLKIRKDYEAIESPYEIIVGNTNRYISQKNYKNSARLMEYRIVVDKGCLQVVCGGLYSANAVLPQLFDSLLTKSSAVIKNGIPLSGNMAQEKVPHSEGTDVRVMTANIIAQSSTSLSEGFPPSIERAEIFAKILLDYSPDFVGVQEADANYARAMSHYFEVIKKTYGIEYSSTKTDINGTPIANYILYRSDKYTLKSQKAELPSYAVTSTSNFYHSVLSSAMFVSKSNPSIEIGMLSAHWHWEQESAVVGTPKQKIDAEQMAAEYNRLQQAHPKAKIFCTGDFNSHRFKNQYFNEFLAAINGAVASTIAKNNGVLTPSFQHYTPKQYIDHIISTDGTFDVLKHAGTNNHSNKLTDHQPVYADIKFTK